MKIAIISPVHNEQERLGQFIDSLKLTKLPLIVVDDGSNDNSSNILKRKKSRIFKVLTHKINLGKGAALKTGCEWAFNNGFDALILMDSDCQHLPSDLDKFITKLNQNYEFVLGSRNLNFGVPLDRFIGNKIASVIVAILYGIYVSDLICGYRALTKRAYKLLKWESTGYAVEVETVIKMNNKKLNYCEVPVETVYYDSFKGVSVLDAIGILISLIAWKFKKI